MARATDEGAALAHKCRCGFGMGDFWIRPLPTYGFVGTLAMLAGVTARPSRVDYVCGVCNETLESVTDPEGLERFRYLQQRRGK